MSDQIETIDAANSILFVGSGFSAGAENIAKDTLPAGNPLKEKLAKILEINPNDYTLRTIVDEFRSRPDLDLYKILYETFTVTKPSEYQRQILNLPWSRIYTTNYDDLIDACKSKPGHKYPTFGYDDPKPRSLPRSFGVHLHGTIRKATPDNVLEQLVLDETSYVRQIAQKPAWQDEFTRDLRAADACYFLGYSLRDDHITAILMQNESARQKTFFISKPEVDSVFKRRIEPYGKIVPIGFEKFADLCRTLPAPTPPADIRMLRAFKYLDPILDKKSLSNPTAIEIINLVTFGNFNQSRYFSSKPEAGYVASRIEDVSNALKKLKTCRTLIIHSRLGNGKTIFISILARSLGESGKRCFLWRKLSTGLEQEIDVLSKTGRIIIIFDDYDAAVEQIPRMADKLPEAQFVVSIRTGQQEVRLHEIVEVFPSKIERLDINGFGAEDRSELYHILDRAGAHVDGLRSIIDTAKEIRDIVTSLYNHEGIKKNIIDELNPILRADSARKILISAHILKWIGVEIEDNFIRSVTEKDAYAEMKKYQAVAGDLFKIGEDQIEVRSSLLSEYILQHVFQANHLIDCIYDIIVNATRRRTERKYRRVAGNLMQISTLRRLFKFRSKNEIDLSRHFDKLSHDSDVNREPLFWLQYAILMIDEEDLPTAQHFLDTGYSRASDIDGFQTYQLDTQALRLYLLREISDDNSSVELFNKIMEALRKVISMISDNSHRSYAIAVLNDIPRFTKNRHHALKINEVNELIFELNRAIQALDTLSSDNKVHSGSEGVKQGLSASIAVLLQR